MQEISLSVNQLLLMLHIIRAICANENVGTDRSTSSNLLYDCKISLKLKKHAKNLHFCTFHKIKVSFILHLLPLP